MKIVIATEVDQPIEQVWKGFNLALFNQLAPPFPPVKVIAFGGCLEGDVVNLELNFGLFKQHWISDIVEQKTTATEIYFIDQAIKTPFFLRFWRHRHRIVANGTGATIIDDIEFTTPTFLTDYLLYPLMYLQFAYRKPIYRRVFS
jgi:ligand-binding SRPBCC domain-containing protein